MMARRVPRPRGASRRGITLVELLIAMVVLAIVVALAGAGIVQALRVQSVNEANTSLQGKLRRVTEVLSQDLRSAVLGVVTNAPFTSTGSAVSFTLAVGGQGYEVVLGSASASGFEGASSLRVVADAALALDGRRVLLVNGGGVGASFPIVTASPEGGNRYLLTLDPACTNSVPWVQPMRLFVVDAVGYRLLPNGDLARQVAGQPEQALAFDLTQFEVQYGYRDADGSVTMRSDPLTAGGGGPPLRVAGSEILDSLRVRVAAEEPTFGNRLIERSYVSQIALPPPGTVNLRSVVTCP